jgi:quinol monooxygenase YgiN
MPDDVQLRVVTMVFDAAAFEAVEPERLAAVLSHYVVVSRTHAASRNIDLCASVTRTGRYVIVEKWATPEAQRAHFDSPEMVAMAHACTGLLASPPDIDLLDGISAHDLA